MRAVRNSRSRRPGRPAKKMRLRQAPPAADLFPSTSSLSPPQGGAWTSLVDVEVGAEVRAGGIKRVDELRQGVGFSTIGKLRVAI